MCKSPTYSVGLEHSLNFDLSLNLHPCFVYESSKGPGETAHMLRLVGAFAIRICDKYQNFILIQFVNNFCDTVISSKLDRYIGFSIKCIPIY